MPVPGRLSAAPTGAVHRLCLGCQRAGASATDPATDQSGPQPRGGLEPIPIGVRSARACRDAAILLPETASPETAGYTFTSRRHIAAALAMTHTLKIALLSLSVLLWGIQASTLADADERDRGRAEPRPETRTPGVRPGPRSEGRPAFDGRGQRLDSRYNHGRYYPPRGYRSALIAGRLSPLLSRRESLLFQRRHLVRTARTEFIVVSPPPGLVISTLPPTPRFGSAVFPTIMRTTCTTRGSPIKTLMPWVDPPDDADAPTPPPPPPDSAQADLIIYPKNGQTKEQQAADQFECYNWRGPNRFRSDAAGRRSLGQPRHVSQQLQPRDVRVFAGSGLPSQLASATRRRNTRTTAHAADRRCERNPTRRAVCRRL